MDEQVEPAVEGLAGLAEDSGNVLVRAHVAFGDERARDRLGQLPHALLDSLTLERERELRPGVGEALRDRPGDRALVRDPENQSALALVHPRHGASINPFG